MARDRLKVIIQAEVDKAVKEIRALNQTTERSSQSFQKMFKSFASGAMALAGVSVSIAAVNRAIRQSLDDWANLERAQVQLQAAIIATGREAETSFYALEQYAGQLQAIGIFGADATMGAMAVLQSMTSLDQQGLKRVTPALQDFAAAMGMDLQQAARMFAGEIEGTSQALRRYGISLDPTLSETERFEALIDQVHSKFGGMNETMAASSTGTFRRLNNELSDMRARGGRAIAEFAQPFAAWLADVVAQSNAAAAAVQNVNDVIAGKTSDLGAAEAAYQTQVELVARLESRLESLSAQRDMDSRRAARDTEQQLAREREQLATISERLAGIREETREQQRQLDLQRQADAAAAEAAARAAEEARINQVAGEFRLKITRDYLARIEELEADSLEMIELQRRRALDIAAENYVKSGEEIALINRFYDMRREAELERMAEAEIAIQQRKQEALEREGQRLAEALRTPYEIYSDSVARLNDLYRAGAIDLDTYNRALEQYREALAGATREMEGANVRGAIFFDTVRDLHDELERGGVTVTRWATDMVSATQAALSPMTRAWSGFVAERERQEMDRHRMVVRNLQNEIREAESAFRDQLRLKQNLGEDTIQFEEDQRTRMLEIEHERAVKEHELAKREFERDKKARTSAAIQGGAQAVVQTFAQLGWPLGVAGAAVVAGITAAQVSKIQGQEFPGLAQGGIVTRRGLYEIGEAGEREAVVPLSRADEFGFGKGGTTVVVHNHGTIVGPGGEREFARTIAREIRRNERQGIVA